MWWEDSESLEHWESVNRLGGIESTHEGKACMSDIPADLDSRGSQAGALAGSQASQATGSSGGEGA